MKNVWSQFLSVLLVAFLAGGSYTGAFYVDNEGAENILTTASLDGQVSGDGFNSTVCTVGNEVETELRFENLTNMPFVYDLSLSETSGDALFCAQLDLSVDRNGDEIYSGDLPDFDPFEGFELDAFSEDVYTFAVSLPEGVNPEHVDGKECFFSTIFSAYQGAFMSGVAFYDTETVDHHIVGASGGGGDVTVINNNHATITNEINVSAKTGGNSNSGGSSGDAGDGGDGGTGGTGGDGGDSGDGGDGGDIETGDANASASVTNVVNTNETTIEGCGCEGAESEGEQSNAVGESSEEDEENTEDNPDGSNTNSVVITNVVNVTNNGNSSDNGEGDASVNVTIGTTTEPTHDIRDRTRASSTDRSHSRGR